VRTADLAALLGGPEGDAEPERIRRALEATGGDRQRAASLLGMSVRSLQRRIRELDLGGVPRYR
jgi:transcriptional regulator with PAS, ATPase and Fis domain